MSASNELRVFISSTFRDLQEEREHLIKKIFPEIRSLCRERGVTFTEIDLRWGLTEEEGSLGRIIRICLEEVDRCKPYFIGLLGAAYGWVPDIHEVYMDPELLSRYPWVEQATMDGTSVTELEFMQGVFLPLAEEDAPENIEEARAFFYQRQGDLQKGENKERLQSLIERSESTGHPYRTFEESDELGAKVRDDLVAVINSQWAEEVTPSAFELEQRAHAAFATSRIRAYIPQGEYLQRFAEWLQGAAGQPLVVTSQSGAGKSSLVAFLAENYRRRNPEAVVIEHYVGVSDSSTTIAGVIEHLLEEIRVRFSINEKLPSSPHDLERSLPGWLHRLQNAASNTGVDVLVIIDAVNQMEERAQSMLWLPGVIPPGIKLMISTTPGTAEVAMRERGWDVLRVEPIEDERVRQSIVVRYLGEFHKGIDPEQLQRLSSAEMSSSPLYLRVVTEELRLHGRHETVADLVTRYTTVKDLGEVFQRLLERMEVDYGRETMEDFLGLIAVSRSGLSEQEVLEVSSLPWEQSSSGEHRPGISRLKLSRLLFALDYHLLRRNGLLDFFHVYLEHAVRARHLSDRETTRRYHFRLASYFASTAVDNRRIEEEPWQWEQSGDDGRLVDCLCDPEMFLRLNKPQSRYELIGYWRRLHGRHDPVESYRARLAELRRDGFAAERAIEFMESLGEFFTESARYTEAEPLLRTVYRYHRLSSGRESEATARAMDLLATAVYHEGDFIESEALWREALRILEQRRGLHHPSLCPLLDSLAATATRRNDIEDQLRFITRSLEISEAVHGREHPESIERLVGLAESHIARRNRQPAIDLLNEALAICRRTLGVGHPTTARIQGELGYAIGLAGHIDEAIEVLTAAAALTEEALGEHIALSRVLEIIGTMHIHAKTPSVAENYYRRAWEIRCRLQGADHPDSLQSETHIAVALRHQEKYAEAEALVRGLLPRQIAILGPDHMTVKRTIRGLIAILGATDRVAEAEMYQRELDTLEQKPAASAE